jgi:hypothetical protein
MPSQKQIEANRNNAQKSTGPKTPEGLLVSSRNAIRHGLTAEQVVISGEEESDSSEIFQAYEAEVQPATVIDHTLVHQIVAAHWRLRRLRQIETGFFELQFLDHKRRLDDDYSGLDNHHKLAFVVQRDTMSSNMLLSLSRYETRLERSFYRALHELRSLQATRPAPSSVPNEPNSENPGTVRTIPQQPPAVEGHYRAVQQTNFSEDQPAYTRTTHETYQKFLI